MKSGILSPNNNNIYVRGERGQIDANSLRPPRAAQATGNYYNAVLCAAFIYSIYCV